MGFDLSFFREPRHGLLTRERLSAVLARYPHGRFRPENTPIDHWVYENFDTGVTFALNWFEPADPEKSTLPADRAEFLRHVPSIAELLRRGKSRGFVTIDDIAKAMAQGVLPRDQGRDAALDIAVIVKRHGVVMIDDPDIANESDDDIARAPQRTPLGLSVAFARPSFFGAEAIEFAVWFCDQLQLVVLDPQAISAGLQPLPAEPSRRALFDSWDVANRKAVQVMFQPTHGIGSTRRLPATALPPAWPKSRLDAWWRFSFAKPILSTLHRKATVPKMFLIQPEREESPQAMICWSQAAPIVLPNERDLPDLLQIVIEDGVEPDPPAGLARGEFLLRWAEAKPILLPFITAHKDPVPHLVLDPGRVAAYTWGDKLVASHRLALNTYLHAGITPETIVDLDYLA